MSPWVKTQKVTLDNSIKTTTCCYNPVYRNDGTDSYAHAKLCFDKEYIRKVEKVLDWGCNEEKIYVGKLTFPEGLYFIK